MSRSELLLHAGACHCGGLRFDVEAPAEIEVLSCNCSICTRTGYLHLVVEREHFHLREGAELLTEYRFGSGLARHYFCQICGIKAFYVPRSKPDGYSVNLRCIDRLAFSRVVVVDFDGRDWEAAFAAKQRREIRGEGAR
ncbi:MAG TPA: GFA family protein [Nannocystis exedens]|nr:GFA family protein [Nannocystis exedens]